MVSNGVYLGGVVVSKPLTVRSVNGPGFTVIDGNQAACAEPELDEVRRHWILLASEHRDDLSSFEPCGNEVPASERLVVAEISTHFLTAASARARDQVEANVLGQHRPDRWSVGALASLAAYRYWDGEAGGLIDVRRPADYIGAVVQPRMTTYVSTARWR